MENQLTELMSKVYINKVSFFRDTEKGFILPYETKSLLCSCKNILLTDELIKQLKDNKIVTEDYEFKKDKIETKKVPSKTKPNTIVDEKIQTYLAWEVKNALGAEYFNNKEEAMRKAEELNARVSDML